MVEHKRRTALVTGGGRGIGRGIALALAENGWQVAINYRSNRKAALETWHAVEETGSSGIVVQADIADGRERQRLVADTLESFGRIDLLVNNAGMAPRQRRDLLDLREASYDEVMAVNLKGPFFLTQLVARTLIELLEQGVIKEPKIVNIGSVSAYTSSVQRGEYCLSKAGLAMMTALFADRLAEYGIYVYEVRPGIIDTDMTRGVHDRYDELLAAGLAPIQRWGQPADVARAVVAIAQGYLSYSTGEVINVDGGYHLRRL